MGPRGDAILYTPALCCAAETAESRQKHLRTSWQVYSVICGPRWDTVHTVRPCKHAVHDRPVRGRARHVAATRRAVASCCLSVSVCDPWTEERIERAKAVILCTRGLDPFIPPTFLCFFLRHASIHREIAATLACTRPRTLLGLCNGYSCCRFPNRKRVHCVPVGIVAHRACEC